MNEELLLNLSNLKFNSKARKLNRLKLIEKIDEDTWLVHPIQGYNIKKTPYTITLELDGYLICTCDGFKIANLEFCSHCKAVILYELNLNNRLPLSPYQMETRDYKER